MGEHFTHLFPEWALAWSLREASTANAALFWEKANLHPTGTPENPLPLAKVFSQVTTVPSLQNERPFPQDGASRYGFDGNRYRSTFGGLRPDFLLETDDVSLVILIEAKGGHVPQSTWKDPKELSYFRFLNECKVPRYKGFVYIIPAEHADKCRNCLEKYFPLSEGVRTGFLLWEELLPIIYDKLVETAIDQVIKEMEGLKCLREWRRVSC